MNTDLNDILKATGASSQRDLARMLGVSQHCVWGWWARGRISADGAIAIEALTKGKLKARKIREGGYRRNGGE